MLAARDPAIWLFGLAVLWVGYAYLGYPILLYLLWLVRRRPVQLSEAVPVPAISVIVAVHNGKHQIRDKLQNLLEQELPDTKVQLIVADDASEDGTAELIGREFVPHGVQLVRRETRGGKERAQSEALGHATGSIVVFTDVGTRMDRSGLQEILRPFADPSVGCVSSEDRVRVAAGQESGEGLYVRYEMALRKLESEVRSLVGVSGSFFAIKKDLCADFSETLPSDFRSVLSTVEHGQRAVVAPTAFGYYDDIAAGKQSRQRRVRTILRGMTAIFHERRMLNPLRFGVFAWQLWSHKIARWSVPFGLILALICSIVLSARYSVFVLILALQLFGYIFAAITLMRSRPPLGGLGKLARYLGEANLAALVAWLRFARGDRIVNWQPTKR